MQFQGIRMYNIYTPQMNTKEGRKKFPADFFKVRKELPVPFVS